METETSKRSENIYRNTDTDCAIGKCKSKSLQKCKSLLCFTVFYCLISFVLSASSAFLSTQITSIEKQFDISSSTTGLLLSSTEIGYLATVLFTIHFCKRLHIPRVLGLTGLVFGLLAILKSLVNFAKPVILPEETLETNLTNPIQYLCMEDNSSLTSTGSFGQTNAGKENNWAVGVFGIIMALQGALISARGSIMTAFIDDNVRDRSKTSYYLGIITASSTFGPAVSLLLGGAFSRIPVDLKNTYLTPSDPRWVGAWWLGFVILGTAIVLLSIPITFFPSRMPGTPIRAAQDNSRLTSQVKDLPLSVWRSLTRPIFMLAMIARCIHLFAMMGQIVFSPKHLQTQFNIPAYQANLMLGIANVITTSFGTMIGGYLTGRLHMNKSKCAIFVIVVHGFGVIFNSLGMVFGCDNTPIEGLDFVKQSNNSSDVPCFCDKSGFLFSCGEDGITYSNPCVAGCLNETENVYGGCSRVEGLSVTPGICDNGCYYLYPFLVSLMLMSVMGTLGTIPHYILLIRSVDERDKAMSVGLTDVGTYLIGTIPAPIVYGKVIDTACKVVASSTGPGACFLYDIVDFRYRMFGMEVGLKCFALLLLVMVYILCRIDESKVNRVTEKELQIPDERKSSLTIEKE